MCCFFCAYNIHLMQVYYVPVWVVYNQCTFPTLFTTFPLIRYILLREEINIVHGHSVCIFFSYIHYAIYSNKITCSNKLGWVYGGIINAFICCFDHLLLTFSLSFFKTCNKRLIFSEMPFIYESNKAWI